MRRISSHSPRQPTYPEVVGVGGDQEKLAANARSKNASWQQHHYREMAYDKTTNICNSTKVQRLHAIVIRMRRLGYGHVEIMTEIRCTTAIEILPIAAVPLTGIRLIGPMISSYALAG